MGFVRGRGHDPDDSAIVASVVGLARAVGIDAVAEGLDTAEQLGALQELGCAFGQGFLLSRPVPAVELERTGLAEPRWRSTNRLLSRSQR